MIRTHGLTHISLAVNDPDRSYRFYHDVFGVEEYYRDDTQIQAKSGSHDILVWERDLKNSGRTGGIRHFGFRLVDPEDIDAAVDAVLAAGGKLLRRGEWGPDLPYAYVHDLDGYEIEIWFE
jgi:catechol 2,3-dioxygenase-like lactoylglutathione lyase family enzyme